MGLLAAGLWKDDRYLELDRDERLVWIFVVAGPHAAGLPGLFDLGPLAICERMAEEVEFAATAQRALEHFHELGLAHLDRKKWIIRIPNAPRHNPPANPNHVRGWWRKWQLIPDRPIRYEHIADLRVVVDRIAEKSTRRDGAGWQAAWAETFGTVSNAHAPKQASLFYEVSKREHVRDDKGFESSSRSTHGAVDSAITADGSVQEDDPDGVDPQSVCSRSVGAFHEVLPEDVAKRRIRIRNPHPDQDQIPVPRSGAPIPEGSAEGNNAPVVLLRRALAEGTSPGVDLPVGSDPICESLWELQEDLRAPLTGGGRQQPTSANLADVAACLAEVGGDVATVETVLRSFAVESRGYLIGGTNWKLSVFRIELGKVKKSHGGGYYKAKEGQKFGDGKSVVTRKH
jgi:hypothetical protein